VRISAWLALLPVAVLPLPSAAEVDWSLFAGERVVEILTDDEDGALRETKVWIVVVDGHGFVRTNGSHWLANIRRGSPVALRADGHEVPVKAREAGDQATFDRIETAFKEKYGWMQQLMSALRLSRPSVLELSDR
jgi:hypothetical protein